jgi:two-component system OmpR family sensor kinase
MNVFRSIRWRLQLWYGALFAVVLAGLGVTAYEVEANARLDRIDAELEQKMFALSGSTRRPPPPPPGKNTGGPPTPARRGVFERERIAQVFTPADEAAGFYFALWQKNDAPKYASSGNAPADIPKGGDKNNRQTVRQRGSYREALMESNPGDITLVGRSVEADLADLHRFGWLVAGGGASMFAIVMAIGWWLVTRALRPIEEISRAAAKIATGDLAQRIDTRETESELGALTGVLNSTFARLEASFAQQSRFTADAAHELRTPVTVVLTHVQNTLAEGGLTDDQRHAFEACQRAAQRMRRMIESLLQLSRFDAGQEAITMEAVDLAVVAEECVELIQPIAQSRQIAIHTELASIECRGDTGRLGQVITNLVGNAIHHNREGGEVRVTTRAEGHDALVIVADRGPGIAPEHVGHIFERFYRVDKARTAAAGRTGLGLAISKAIVDAHGGTISVESVVGQGSTFTVRVPRA